MNLDAFDKILITDLLARGRLGVPAEERMIPQDILINLVLYTDTRRAGESDSIDDSVDYAITTRSVLELVEKSTRHTVEALAEDIAQLCLCSLLVSGVSVRIEKPNKVRFTRSVGVEILRFKPG
jgi:FolB domain-containing protein